MTTPFTIPHDADTISNAITKVVNSQSIGTLASNANLADNSVIKSYVDAQIASSLATQLADIKTGFRPKYAQLQGGTTSLTKQNQTSTTVYNVADFTVNMSNHPDFATSKITGLVVQGYVRSPQNANEIQYYLPEGGVATRLCRVAAASGSQDDVQVSVTDTIPLNPNSTTVTFTYGVGNTTQSLYNEIKLKGVIYLPGLD